MNLFKIKIIIIALVTTTMPLFTARITTTTKTSPVVAAKQQPAPQPAATSATQLISNITSYKELFDAIKTKMHSTDVWDSTNKRLKDLFVAAIKNYAKDANLTAIELEALLQAGRSFHATFTGDKTNDSQTLTNVNNQIASAKNDFIKSMPAESTIAAPANPVDIKFTGTNSAITEPAAAKTVIMTPTITKPLPPIPVGFTQPAGIVNTPEKTTTQSPSTKPVAITPAATEPVETNPTSIKPTSTKKIIAPTPEQEQVAPFMPHLIELEDRPELSGSDELPQARYTPALVQGIFQLQEFIKSSPETFGNTLYVNGELNTEWLKQALKIILNKVSLSEKNRVGIQEELSTNAMQLIKDLFKDDTNVTPEQLKKMLNNVHNQIVRFINQQPSIQQLKSEPQESRRPIIQQVAIKPQELGQAKLPTVPSVPNKTTEQVFSAQTTLTLQSILDGALEEPYTSKANDVYNSGVSFYVDDMVKAINNALNSKYPNESARINAIKLSINRNYNFLANYRKNNPAETQQPAALIFTTKEHPNWIVQKDQQTYNLNCDKFKQTIYNIMLDQAGAFEEGDMNNSILEHFKQQLPNNIPNKNSIIDQMRKCITDYLG